MKGLLSGMSIPSLLSKSPKRHRKSPGGSRKKSRKASGQSSKVNFLFLEEDVAELKEAPKEVLPEPLDLQGGEPDSSEVEEDAVDLSEAQDEAHAAETEPSHETERCISFSGDSATVRLSPNQRIAIDGWAMVSLLEGRASVHGYSLSPGVAVLLCSNSKLSAVVTIESQCVDGVNQHEELSNKTSVQSSGELGSNVPGCVLEFKSYRGVESSSGTELDNRMRHEHAEKRTFRLEVEGETLVRDLYVEHLVQKRKREDLGAGSAQDYEARNGEDMSDSGEYSDDGGKEILDDQVDMDVDEQPDASDGISDDENRRKAQKVAHAPLQTIIIPESWWGAARSIKSDPSERPPIVAVCGAKNAGKSTFGRFLMNYLLNSYGSIGYLDTDVGQPEFTVPGCLSLHILKKPVFGSPVLHLQNPERSFFYGDNSPKSDPEMYCRSVEALYDYFQQTYAEKLAMRSSGAGRFDIPLIINTHGWLKGVGFDVLVNILRHTSPTHLVHINSIGGNNNLPAGKFWEASDGSDSTTMLYIENVLEGPNKPLTRIKTASDHLRDARIMAYFRQFFWRSPLPYPYREDRLFAQTALKLVSCPPYQVPISDVKILHLHCQVPPREKLYSINGALVGLGVSSRMEKKSGDGPKAVCVGLGIVRGVDPEKGVLYLITPLDIKILRDVDILLQGRVEVPIPLLQARGYISPYLCHNSVAIEGTGSIAIKARKRYAKGPKRTN